MKVLIVDDEKQSVLTMETILAEYFDKIEIIGKCNSAAETRKFLNNNSPDLVFLDINMPGENAFEFLQNLDDIPFQIIFVTAYDEFAIKAFEFSAVDYILKPVTISRLKNAMDKVEKRIEVSKGSSENYKALLENIQHQKPVTLFVSTSEGTDFVKIDEIIRIEGDINYSKIILTGKKEIFVAKTLLEFEKKLTAYGFYRSHRSHLINLSYVTRFLKKDGGTIVMADNTTILLAKKNRAEFMKTMEKFSLK